VSRVVLLLAGGTEGTFTAFYEKCGFSKKENEMVSVESPYQIVFSRFASRRNTRPRHTLQESFNLAWVLTYWTVSGRHVQILHRLVISLEVPEWTLRSL
jgi:hypothetical protein